MRSNRKLTSLIVLTIISVICISSAISVDVPEPFWMFGNYSYLNFDPIVNFAENPRYGSPYDDGLVGYWNMNEGSGSIIADSSGYDNNGTTSGNLWTDGKFGKSLNFNRINSSATILNTNYLSPSNFITVTAWIDSDDLTQPQHIVSKRNGTNGYILQTGTGNKAYAYVSVNNTFVVASGTAKLTPNAWHFLALTYDGKYLRLFVDGIQDGISILFSGFITSGEQSLSIGNQPGGLYPFSGKIDEVRIFNRALTAQNLKPCICNQTLLHLLIIINIWIYIRTQVCWFTLIIGVEIVTTLF